MFEPKKTRGFDLINHWYVLLPNFQTSTSEFYEAVSQELTARRVPGMEISALILPEGGALSPRREYLRMRRERLAFDVCSAAFGKSWFFSCRFSEKRSSIRIWHALVMLAVLAGIFYLYTSVFGLVWGVAVGSLTVVASLFLLNNVATTGLHDLDAVLLKIPVLGTLYETFLRPETYYREDCRLVYCDLVDGIVRGKVEEIAGVQDVTKIQFTRIPIPPRTGLLKSMGDGLKRLWQGLTTH